MFPLVSIVIVNYNGLEHLEDCLSTVTKTEYPNYEIIFVDNASSDGSVQYVEKIFTVSSAIRIINNDHNLGATGGYNTGIIHAKGRYIAILNNDVEVSPNWLTPLIEMMEADESIAAVDAKYLNFYNRERFDNVAAAGRYVDYAGTVYARGANEIDNGRYDKPVRIFAALTLFRRSVFEEVGLFDEDFFYGYDEIDLAWRISLRGYKVMYVPSSKIYHKVSQTSRSGNSFRSGFYFMIKRNRLQMLIKNIPGERLLPALAVTLLEYGFYLLYWLSKKNRPCTLELISSVLWVIRNLRKIWLKRKAVQRIKGVSHKELKEVILSYRGDLLKIIRKISV